MRRSSNASALYMLFPPKFCSPASPSARCSTSSVRSRTRLPALPLVPRTQQFPPCQRLLIQRHHVPNRRRRCLPWSQQSIEDHSRILCGIRALMLIPSHASPHKKTSSNRTERPRPNGFRPGGGRGRCSTRCRIDGRLTEDPPRVAKAGKWYRSVQSGSGIAGGVTGAEAVSTVVGMGRMVPRAFTGRLILSEEKFGRSNFAGSKFPSNFFHRQA